MVQNDKTSIVIKKVALEHKPPVPEEIHFPAMPNMYLELVENKNKVKQSLVNKEYVPGKTRAPVSPHHLSARLDQLLDNDEDDDDEDDDEVDDDETAADEYAAPAPVPVRPKYYPVPVQRKITVRDVEGSRNSSSSDDEDDDEDEDDEGAQVYRNFAAPDFHDDDEEDDRDGGGSRSSSDGGRSSVRQPPPVRRNPLIRGLRTERYESPYISPSLLVRQQQFQKPTDKERALQREFASGTTYRQVLPQDGDGGGGGFRKLPPTLSDLNLDVPPVIPNLENMQHNTEEQDLKRQLLFRFEQLRDKNPHLPEYTMHSDYKTMKQTYDHVIRKLSISDSVEHYKTYLIGGFMLVEYALGNWVGFDMQGFVQQQMVSMSSYEKLLIELGEKSYVEEESQWPVEVRLLGVIAMNAAFFIMSKLMMKKTGANILNMINSMNQHPNAPAQQTPSGGSSAGGYSLKKKRKMRGPNIDFDNLPDLSAEYQ